MMEKTVYQVGDRVIPEDLPRPLVCRVRETDDVSLGTAGHAQILTLEPLDGPWERGITLVRLDSAVRPAEPRGAWPGRVVERTAVAC